MSAADTAAVRIARRAGRTMPDMAQNAERGLMVVALAAILCLPVLEVVTRPFAGEGMPGSIDFVRHLTLWIGFLGAMLAVREERHLTLGIASALRGRWRAGAETVGGALTVTVCLVLATASFDMMLADRASLTMVGGILPLWIAEIIMPAGFAVIGLRFFAGLAGPRRKGIVAAASAVALAGLAVLPPDIRPLLLAPGFCIVLLAAIAGTPIFAVLGGAAVLLFYADGTPLAAVSAEAYRIASNPILPTVPLFTLAGAVLAESQASSRLVRAFRALFGWFPGGTAIVTIAVCAFFTTFSGGSGVTLLALGGLLLPVLVREGYGGRFSLGTITASGSLGILFPPSLLIILYGVTSFTPIDRLFMAALPPGLMLMAMVFVYAAARGRTIASRVPFDRRELAAALRAAKWEMMLPVVVLFCIFSGLTTLVEAAAVTVLYTIAVAVFVHRELHLRRDLPRVFVECGVLVGGIMIILAAAMGLANYLVFTDVPGAAASWIRASIEQRWVFLLGLNAFLLVAGCFLDIFSAIVVLVPLIAPVAAAYGVNPLHLGVIFLANMELGYLTPPVGMNLFLASLRFDRPLMEVYRATLPYFLLILAGVLVITYVPWISLVGPGLLD